MSAGPLLWAATAFTIPPAASLLWSCLFGRRYKMISGWISSASSGGGAALWNHDWAFLSGAGASLLIALAIWWRRRKKRRSAAALIGAKSRALRDALVRKAREAARPRPVLRPVPGGAR